MTSILTNTGAMTALQTLKGINANLEKTQNEISTGKKVATAADDAAVFAISKVMESDVVGFKKLNEGMAVAESTVAVARNAAETVTELLIQTKDKIVQAQDPSQDQAKIQADIVSLREQISTVVNAAQFNGINMVADGASTDVLSSLNRDGAGNVTSSNITVNHQDLSVGTFTSAAALAGSTGAATANDRAATTLGNGGGTASLVFDTSVMTVGDRIEISIGGDSFSAVYSQGDADATDPNAAFATRVKSAIDSFAISDGTEATDLDVDFDPTAPNTLVLTNDTGTDLSVSAQYVNQGAGGLGALDAINVDDGAGGDSAAALAAIDGLIDTSTDAAAAFGTAQNQLTTQMDFVSKLSDAMTAGIGSMVDADMEAASARLQALQTQQQLGIQSLSIANSAPQNILSLFR